jgi:hypothetical protein
MEGTSHLLVKSIFINQQSLTEGWGFIDSEVPTYLNCL